MSVLVILVGCVHEEPTDYSNYLTHFPTSVLVLPPLNESNEIRASTDYLSTVTTALGECGYYVYPIALVDHILKQEGVPTPGEMHGVSLPKLRQVFGADAVLYVTIKEWSSSYAVITAATTVTAEYRLVDARTGTELWRREHVAEARSQANAGGGGLLGLVISATINAAVHALVDAATNQERILAIQANAQAFNLPEHGLLRGVHHPEYEKEQARLRKQAP